MFRFTLTPMVLRVVAASILALTLVPHAVNAANHRAIPAARLAAITTDTCDVIQVQLNGDQPAAVSCKYAKGAVRPLITEGNGPCDGTDVAISDDYNFGGQTICFHGYGTSNFAPYGMNDRMTSWKSGNWGGKIYWDENSQGTNFGFAPNQQNANVGSGWNDKASSICIAAGGASSCP